jgi:hypothetical protein
MPKNDIRELRKHLFETIEALKDPKVPMEIERAKAVCAVARELVNSAKVEVEYLNATGAAIESEFLAGAERNENHARTLPQDAASRNRGLSTGKSLGAVS